MRLPRIAVLIALGGMASLMGCDHSIVPPCDCGGPPPYPPPARNDSPIGAVARLADVYENQVLAEHEGLLTADFGFAFSSQADPALVASYGVSWTKDEEVGTTSHLFQGFTNEGGAFLGPASSIELSFAGPATFDDPAHPDSGGYYQVVIVPQVNLRVSISGGEEFVVSGPHDFHVVRGDAAVLDPGQEARPDRWYIRRWADKALAWTADRESLATTWGAIKARYHR